MSREMMLMITCPPSGWISSNQRDHWRTKAIKTKTWRNLAHWHANGAPAFDQPVRIIATIHKATSHKFDAHNLQPTVKAAIDGIVDAGLIPDDDNDHLVGVEFRAGEKRVPPCLVLRIEVA